MTETGHRAPWFNAPSDCSSSQSCGPWWYTACDGECQAGDVRHDSTKLDIDLHHEASIDLCVLDASKAINNEASTILYRSNVFTFLNSWIVDRFVRSIPPRQRPNFHDLRLGIVLWEDQGWLLSLTSPMSPHLTSSTRPSLAIDLGLLQPFRRSDGTEDTCELIDELCPGLLKLLVLPLRHVDVTAKDKYTWLQHDAEEMENAIHTVLLNESYTQRFV